VHAWVIWVIVGTILIIAEMATLTFYLLCLGAGALAGAVAAMVWPDAWAVQVILAAVVALLLTFFSKPLTKRVRAGRGFRDAIDELVGKQGTVMEEIPVGKPGVVKVAGEMWTATAADAIPAGTPVIVVNRGNTVIEVEKWRGM
jgi:membrane protein implicated in regulation of membrane protease activity